MTAHNNNKCMKAFVGCSGFNYRGWKGKFYPADLPQNKWLEYYCSHFNTIEINATFYRFPTEKSLKTWYDKTPKDFVFSIKVPGTITHYKRFKETKEISEKFYSLAGEGLKEKLHCVFFQLPPSLAYSDEMLNAILENADPDFKNVFEFRHASWWNNEVYKEFRKHNVIFCSSSFPKLPEDFVKTADDVYLRFHGREELYKSSYNTKELKYWSDTAKKEKVKTMYAYFNNTSFLASIDNAKEMNRLLNN